MAGSAPELGPRIETGDGMVGTRWLGYLVRWLVLGSMVGVGGCASVEYRVPTWEVQRLTELPPGMRGGEVRVVPSDAVVPPPPVLVADPPPSPEVGIDVEIPVVVAPRPVVVVGPRPAVFPRQVGATVGSGPRAAPPAGGGWKSGPPANTGGGWRPAPAPSPHTPTAIGRSSGGRHGGHGGGGAGAAAGAVAAVALIAILADAAVTAAEADTARRYDGWVAVEAGHPLRLFYGGGLGRVVPLAQLGPADLIGLQNAVLVESDGHVEPLRRAPLPAAGPPPPSAPLPAPAPVALAPPAPTATPAPAPVALAPPAPGATPAPTAAGPAPPRAVAAPPPAPPAPPAPVSQVPDPETP